jgi:hypothetical protein
MVLCKTLLIFGLLFMLGAAAGSIYGDNDEVMYDVIYIIIFLSTIAFIVMH